MDGGGPLCRGERGVPAGVVDGVRRVRRLVVVWSVCAEADAVAAGASSRAAAGAGRAARIALRTARLARSYRLDSRGGLPSVPAIHHRSGPAKSAV
ncbi:hypothetical protein ACFXAZ_36835 [Streptomyces sp. NPDC059477]|uniref:hypothetical protein n=1 Tax=Streptomyces sp. NPDC059477 TaxID=3346847 RepID=UPI00369BE01D